MADGIGRPWIVESVREVIVVVLGILIAFSLDAWWDARQDGVEERHLLVSLLQEFNRNDRYLRARIRNHERLAASARALHLKLVESTSTEARVPDTLLFSLFVAPTYNPSMGTLTEALSTGRIGLIQNSELRRMLRGWTGRWEDVQEDELAARELVQYELYHAIGNQVMIADLLDNGGRWIRDQLGREVASGSRSISVTAGLSNYTKHREVSSRRAAQELRVMRDDLRTVIDLLGVEVPETLDSLRRVK